MHEEALSQLAPCPFCGGGTTEIRENGRTWTGTGWGEPCSVSVWHWCDPVPGQPSRGIERVGRDLPSAVASWNKRRGRRPLTLDRIEDLWNALEFKAPVYLARAIEAEHDIK